MPREKSWLTSVVVKPALTAWAGGGGHDGRKPGAGIRGGRALRNRSKRQEKNRRGNGEIDPDLHGILSD